MDWGSPLFVIAIIVVSTGGWLVSTWIRAKHGYPIENEWSGMSAKSDLAADRKIALLSNENDQLKGMVGRLEERVAVLERIATDRGQRLSDEIERLR